MTITIDGAGRIVVPKTLRERFGLHAGVELQIEATADGLQLRSLHAGPSFIEKQGVLVHHGPEVAAGVDVADFINKQREVRSIETGKPTQ
jgi:AbrB family looped-hinge helix DNA binding protein